jgi:hypothetical protein
VTIAVWSDPNGDGDPTDGLLLGSVAGTIQNEGTDTFVNYTFSPPVDVSAFTSFFVGDMTPANGGPEHFFQGLDENGPLHMQSWIAANSDGSNVDITISNNDSSAPSIASDFPVTGSSSRYRWRESQHHTYSTGFLRLVGRPDSQGQPVQLGLFCNGSFM